MPSSPYIEVSQETRARIAEIRRRASAAEGRQVRNDEIVAGLIDDRAVLARMGTMIDEAIESLVDDAGGCMASMPALDAAKVPLRAACKALGDLKAVIGTKGRITGAAELFAHEKGMRFTVSIGIPEVRIAGAADPEREARRAMIEYLEDFAP